MKYLEGVIMALIACTECGKPISNQSKACPLCGAKNTRPVGPIGIIVAGMILFTIFKCSATAPRTDGRTPEQIAAAKAEDKADTKRLTSTAMVLTSIKATLRDPDSVQWATAYSNDLATVVCVEYRARNGFGGMNLGYAALGSGQLSTNAKHYRKHCSNGLWHDTIKASKFIK
jgi:RNA polymerase subunit RPABC4/transcription elongation factor Spt4